MIVDPVTGEISAEALDAAALDYVLLLDEATETAAMLADMRKRLDRLRSELVEVIETGDKIDAGPAYVVRTPGPRPSQRVSRSGCERYSEELLALGIGRVAFEPPGIAEVRRNAARIIAAGVDLEAIAPTPADPPDTLQVVPKE